MARKRREIPANWIKIDVSSLEEKIKRFAPYFSLAMGIRQILHLFFELVEALEEIGLPLPREGKVKEWLQIIRTSKINPPPPTTFRELIEQNKDKLSGDRFSSRLQELLGGAEPTASDAILVSYLLELDAEYVESLRLKQHHQEEKTTNHERYHEHCD